MAAAHSPTVWKAGCVMYSSLSLSERRYVMESWQGRTDHSWIRSCACSNLKRHPQRSRQQNSPFHDVSHPYYVPAPPRIGSQRSHLDSPGITRRFPSPQPPSAHSATFNDGANHQPPYPPRGRNRQSGTPVLTPDIRWTIRLDLLFPLCLTQYIPVDILPYPRDKPWSTSASRAISPAARVTGAS